MCNKKFGDWTVRVGEDDYSIFNATGANGSKKFYEVVKGPHQNPVIIVEPDLAFDAPKGLTYVNAQGGSLDKKGNPIVPTEKIGGVICQDEDGAVVHRFSLSSDKAPKYQPNEDGILIDGERWFLGVLFSKDKNRMFNFDAFYVRKKPAQVKIIELADLNFSQLL